MPTTAQAEKQQIKNYRDPRNSCVGQRLPTNPMLLLGFPVTIIVIRMQVLAGGLQGLMTQVVADGAQVNLLVSHMGARGVP